MVKPWEISRDDIEEWVARSPIEATAVLPRLVRRLLFATSPLGGIAITMRADGGTRYEGWDGTVRARSATTVCPAALSVWELSLEKNVRKKLDGDYETRVRKPPEGVRPALITYVAVTARPFSRKAQWAAERKAEHVWADVRAYDADDLATWLEQAPAVARWFANLQGRPAYEGTDVGAFLDAWCKRTSPPLPADLVLAGEERRKQSDDLLAWIRESSDRPLLVRGRTREEALVFAAASLARETGGEERLARALVAETEEAWRWAVKVQRASSLIVLPAFDNPDVGQAAAEKVQLILPVDLKVPEQRGATLTLDLQPWRPMAKALASAGFALDDAESLVQRADGDLAALQRLCGYFELPPWARDSTRAELLALLLAGAWIPTYDGDREVLRRLGGDPAVVEQLCAELKEPGVMTQAAEPFLEAAIRWTAPEDKWKLLVRGLTESHLKRFRDLVMDVLGARDPEYELPKEERFMGAAKRNALRYSNTVRQGLAESVVRLSLHDDVFVETLGPRRGSGLAEGIIRSLLRLEGGWIAWASLSGLLPTLAEAAPKTFLERVEASLDQGPEGVGHLFLEQTDMFGGVPHVGLLRALETLAWHPEKSVLLRVVRALTRLDAHYPGGHSSELDDGPLRSLNALLRYAQLQSNTTTAERIGLIGQVFQWAPPMGRRIGLEMLNSLHEAFFMHEGAKPRFHKCELKQADGEITEHGQAVLQALVTDAGSNAERWAKLLEAVLHQSEDQTEHVLHALAQQEHVRDDEGVLWSALRRALEDRSAPRHATRLLALYEVFTPEDFARRHAWLFERYVSMPALLCAGSSPEECLADARADAINGLWKREDPWESLARLVREVCKEDQEASAPSEKSPITLASFDIDVAEVLGRTLGESAIAAEVELRILADKTEEPFTRLVVSFAATRAVELGLPCLEVLLSRFVNHGRTTEAAKIAAAYGVGMPLWELLERVDEQLVTEYWTITRLIHLKEPSFGEVRYAVDHLLAVGRGPDALKFAASHRGTTNGALAFQVLERLTRALPADWNRIQGMARYVEGLFEIIDREPPADKDSAKDLAPLELYYLPLLPQRSRPARYVSVAFAENPDLFAQQIGEQDEIRAGAAPRVPTILDVWRGYPGEGLPEAERDAKLETWAAEVFRKTGEGGRADAASIRVAEVLARVPQGDDGFWPCLAARRLLEVGVHSDFAEHLVLAKRNLRGTTGRRLDEGGSPERELAEADREASRQLDADYPRTAAMLERLARHYDSVADRQDVRARRFHIEHGEQPEEEEPPSTPRTTAAPLHREPISRLVTTGVGPAAQFDVPLRPRLNLLIGDNSLGKTFILEVLWWALTGTWADLPARPLTRRSNGHPAPVASIRAEAAGRRLLAEYDPAKERWKKKGTRALAPGLAVHARADGSFSVWDPIRNARPADKAEQDFSKGYHFTPRELLYGLMAGDGITKLCRGLIEDTVSWRSERRRAFAALEKVLTKLSLPEEPIKLGLPRRFKIHDAVTHPTLDLGYDAGVFVVHASAAVKRILGLAYVLVWAVSEIREAAPLAGHAPLERVTLLVDEVEAHLHPRWQRVILPALLAVMEALAPEAQVQLVVTTHAPLVLASVETLFDKAQDELLELEREAGRNGKVVRVVEEPWQRLGDVNTWLVQRFGLDQPRSREAEDAIERATGALEKPKLGKKEWRTLDERLHEVLSDVDPFWVRWHYIADKRGWLS